MPSQAVEKVLVSACMDEALDQLFRSARTHRNWTDKPVPNEVLKGIYEVAKFGPTTANANPLRVLFLTTKEAKERLLPAMAEDNVEKTRTAPVVAIFAHDSNFHEKMDKLGTGSMAPIFAGNPEIAARAGAQSANLQAAYFMITARGFGLDCGPMGGFNAEKVNELFFAESSWRVLFICNLGYGDASTLQPRLPRLEFDEASQII